MAIDRIALLRNFGQFDSVNAGSALPFLKISLVYAENGRGKTTLSAMFRSLGNGNVDLITERQRLGSIHLPHLVLGVTSSTTSVQFASGRWTSLIPNIAVFDDAFVAENVCSGVEIGSSHRQNLHELILGAQGITLNRTLNGHASRIEQHNQTLRVKQEAIPAAARGNLTVDAFCSLKDRPTIDADILAAGRALSAAQEAGSILQRATFASIRLPTFELKGINDLLSRTLPDLQEHAAAQ